MGQSSSSGRCVTLAVRLGQAILPSASCVHWRFPSPMASHAISAAAVASLAASMPPAQFTAFTVAPMHVGNVHVGQNDICNFIDARVLLLVSFDWGGWV